MKLLPLSIRDAADLLTLWEPFVYRLAEDCQSEPAAFVRDIVTGIDTLCLIYDEEREMVRAIVICRISPDGLGRPMLDITHCTGEGVADWEHLVDDLLAWGQMQGCVRARATCRPGWMRLLKGRGFKATHIVAEKDL